MTQVTLSLITSRCWWFIPSPAHDAHVQVCSGCYEDGEGSSVHELDIESAKLAGTDNFFFPYPSACSLSLCLHHAL